jgi:phosphopantothenoylcysteine decarboxylase / phosphopantothenate---cysteine ligase
MNTIITLDDKFYQGKRVLLGVTGSIAAYKAAEIVSRLRDHGVDVNVVMTENATQFITPMTLKTLSRNQVFWQTFDPDADWNPEHISLSDNCDLALVAPATANILAKYVHGIADDLLSSTLISMDVPVIFALAMNPKMLNNPATQANIGTALERGTIFIDPEEGNLACGYAGKGRLAEVSGIVDTTLFHLTDQKDFRDTKVIISAGATREYIDPVRFISNPSSGKMGFALARWAARRGAEVHLVSPDTGMDIPHGVTYHESSTAVEMLQCIDILSTDSDILIMSAAVGDFKPADPSVRKIKKDGKPIKLNLDPNPDIISEIRKSYPGLFIVGFAAETDSLEQNAHIKMEKKKMNMIAANDVSAEGAGFRGNTNKVVIIGKDGYRQDLPLMSKDAVAGKLLDSIINIYKSG